MIMLHVDIIYLAFRGEKNRMHDRYILATRIFNVKFECLINMIRKDLMHTEPRYFIGLFVFLCSENSSIPRRKRVLGESLSGSAGCGFFS